MSKQTQSSKQASRFRVLAGRRKRAAEAVRAAGAEAFLVTHPVEVAYLTGFRGEDSFLLLAGRQACLITDGRFTEQVAAECGKAVRVEIRKGSMKDAVAKVVKAGGAGKVGFDPVHMTVKLKTELSRKLRGVRLVPIDGLLSPLRRVKDDTELASMRRAVRIAEKAFKEMVALGAKGWIGRTEYDLAAELGYRMQRAGAEGMAFPTILAAGPHGSVPHYIPAATRVRANQAVLVDWGARVEGYCSDLTRVVFTGTIPARIREIYEIVRRAQQAGIAAIGPGVECRAVDAAARDIIAKAGYGPQFGHGLGHGLGRLVHESPRLSWNSPDRLETGTVVTVEPGIYLPGVGGVRIEDDVLVTGTSARRLSSLPRDLEAMRL